MSLSFTILPESAASSGCSVRQEDRSVDVTLESVQSGCTDSITGTTSSVYSQPASGWSKLEGLCYTRRKRTIIYRNEYTGDVTDTFIDYLDCTFLLRATGTTFHDHDGYLEDAGSNNHDFEEYGNLVGTFIGKVTKTHSQSGMPTVITEEYIYEFDEDSYAKAKFEEAEAILNVVSSPEDAGTTTGSGSYDIGDVVHCTASVLDPAFHFVRWSTGETTSEIDYTITQSSGTETITAYFEYDTVKFTFILDPCFDFQPKFIFGGYYTDASGKLKYFSTANVSTFSLDVAKTGNVYVKHTTTYGKTAVENDCFQILSWNEGLWTKELGSYYVKYANIVSDSTYHASTKAKYVKINKDVFFSRNPNTKNVGTMNGEEVFDKSGVRLFWMSVGGVQWSHGDIYNGGEILLPPVSSGATIKIVLQYAYDDDYTYLTAKDYRVVGLVGTCQKYQLSCTGSDNYSKNGDPVDVKSDREEYISKRGMKIWRITLTYTPDDESETEMRLLIPQIGILFSDENGGSVMAKSEDVPNIAAEFGDVD